MRNRNLAKSGAVLGIALLVIAAVVPWLQLSSSTLGVKAHGYSPLISIVTGSADGMSLHAYLYFILTAAVIFTTVRWISQKEPRSASRTNMIWLLLCSSAMLILIGVTLIILPTGLALSYPYYDVTLDEGGLLAGAGALAIILSVVVGF